MSAQMVTGRLDQNPVGSTGRLAAAVILTVLVSSCASGAPEDCPSPSRLDLSVIDAGDVRVRNPFGTNDLRFADPHAFHLADEIPGRYRRLSRAIWRSIR